MIDMFIFLYVEEERVRLNMYALKHVTQIKMNSKRVQHWDHVYQTVKSKNISLSLRRCSKLAPSYCGHYEVLSKIGLVAYQFTLPPNIKVRDVFHVSMLKNIYT